MQVSALVRPLYLRPAADFRGALFQAVASRAAGPPSCGGCGAGPGAAGMPGVRGGVDHRSNAVYCSPRYRRRAWALRNGAFG